MHIAVSTLFGKVSLFVFNKVVNTGEKVLMVISDNFIDRGHLLLIFIKEVCSVLQQQVRAIKVIQES